MNHKHTNRIVLTHYCSIKCYHSPFYSSGVCNTWSSAHVWRIEQNTTLLIQFFQPFIQNNNLNKQFIVLVFSYVHTKVIFFLILPRTRLYFYIILIEFLVCFTVELTFGMYVIGGPQAACVGCAGFAAFSVAIEKLLERYEWFNRNLFRIGMEA